MNPQGMIATRTLMMVVNVMAEDIPGRGPSSSLGQQGLLSRKRYGSGTIDFDGPVWAAQSNPQMVRSPTTGYTN